MKGDIRGEFVNGKSGEDVLDRVVVAASLIEVVKESLQGSGWSEGKGGDIIFEGGEEFAELMDEFGEFFCGSLEMVWGMGVMCRFVGGRRRTGWDQWIGVIARCVGRRG